MNGTLRTLAWAVFISAFAFTLAAFIAFDASALSNTTQPDFAGRSDSIMVQKTGVSPTPVCRPDWGVIPVPSVGLFDNLYSVAAITASDIWAVGFFKESIHGPATNLTLHWDGTQWSRVPCPSPGTGSTGSRLYSVDAVSSDDVWAVGYTDYGNRPVTLTVHWDGNQWNVVPSPSPGTGESYLEGVTAIASNDVWAVGDYNYPASQTLVLHWDGTQWTQVASPNPSAYSRLNAVTATASDDVWAVGFYWFAPSVYHTITMHWDGTAWNLVPSPNPGSDSNGLFSVAATSANDVWAVGTYQSAYPIYGPMIVHWDGIQWTEVATPILPYVDFLAGVAAISPNDAWAVGSGGSSSGIPLFHWDGTTWSQVPFTPSLGPTDLNAVAMVSATDVWAVGQDNVNSDDSGWALTGHYAGQCTTATPVTPTPSVTATRTPHATYTPTITTTPTMQSVLVGHVNWEARPSQPDQLQVLPITLTLKSGTIEVNYPTQLTDQYGFFTVTLDSLPNGTYTWRADDSASDSHAPNYLANAGVVAIEGAPITNTDMGVMRTGDANNDNWLSISDFNMLKVSFDSECGNPSYDIRTDFTGDCFVNVSDFIPLKRNFGQQGAPPIEPH